MNWKLALKINKFIHEECIDGVPHDIGANVMKLIECEISNEIVKIAVKSISDDEIMHHAIRCTLKTCPTDEKGVLLDFDKRKKTFYSCVKWFIENYHVDDKTNPSKHETMCELCNSINESYGDAVKNLEEKQLQEKYLKLLKTKIMVKTNAVIQFMVTNPENNKTYVYEKELEFIPSVGLDIEKPIHNKIYRVRHDGEKYIAQIESVLEPTDMLNFDYYINNGFKEINMF